MNDFDFIDIFENEGQDLPAEPNGGYRGQYNEDYNFNDSASSGSSRGRGSSERIRINDFKHTRGAAQTQTRQPRQTPGTERRTEPVREAAEPAPKKKMNVTDEKIVWAGALFVFFGVFVFLIGYWLGKTTMKDVRTTNNEYLSEVEQSLGESRLNTAFASGQTGQSGTVLGDMPDTTQAPEPVASINEPVIAPPVITTTTTTVARATTTTTRPPATTTTTVRQNTASEATGNYTIQVSAHTSVEKARLVEDQLRAAGYNSYIVESMVNGTQYFRVRVGSFTTKSSAEDALAKLKATSDGRDAYLISLD